MRKIKQGRGYAAAGVATIVTACAPMTVDLEHAGSGGGIGRSGTSGDAGMAADTSDVGGSSSGATGGTNHGSAGRGGTGGTGAPLGGTGGDQVAGEEAGQDGSGLPTACRDNVLADVRNGHDLLPGYGAERDPRVEGWLSQMSLSDQIAQMEGVSVNQAMPNYADIQRSEDVPLAAGGILRGYKYRDGSRGVNLLAGQIDRQDDGRDFATAFPASSIRGASWDLELEWRVGEAIGDETAASKNNLLISLAGDLLRHPYWGRAQDTYGEDVYHVGRMGTAFVAGVQQHVGACAHDYIAGGVERLRSTSNALIDEQTLRDIDGRPFEMLVQDGGVACVLAAYGLLNGVNMTNQRHLLRDILKGPVEQGGFGFRGFVISDWWAAPGAQYATDDVTSERTAVDMADAGLDVELPWIFNYRRLEDAVQSGTLDRSVITEAAGRVLEQKARFHTALTTDDFGLAPTSSALSGDSISTNVEHLALSEQTELESAVLLSNGPTGEPVLPIRSDVTKIAVIGADVDFNLISSTVPASCASSQTRNCTFHFATDVALGDRGSDRVNADPAESVGPFAGIQAVASTHGDVTVTSGNGVDAAADADLVVVVVGLTPGDEGEEYAIESGGDRSTLALPSDQTQLVNEALSLMKPTVVVIESGSVVDVSWLEHANQRQATIWAGYGGMRAGLALGKLLFGDADFSGKLPVAWAAEDALPAFGNASGTQDTTLGYFFGYREYDRRRAAGERPEVVFPFGHGLSYTTFAYSNAAVPCAAVTQRAVLDVTVDVKNTGKVSGDEVAFLFVEGPAATDGPRSVKELKSFARVSLAAEASESVHLPLRIQDLKHWSNTANGWVIDPGTYTVLVGPSGADDDLQVAGTFTVPG